MQTGLVSSVISFSSAQVLSAEDKDHLTSNIAGHLKDAQEFIQKRAVGNFAKADPEYGRQIQAKLDKHKARMQAQQVS